MSENPWAPPDRRTPTGPRRAEQFRNLVRAMKAAGITLTEHQQQALDEDHHDEGEAR